MSTPSITAIEINEDSSAVGWGAIVAGGVTAAAMTLVLLALGTGLGFAIVSPWSDSGVSATTFTWTAAIYLIVVAMIASTFGGLVAGWLRTRWAGLNDDQVYFRDTVHGFLAWAVATVFSAAMLGGAATHLAAGTATGLATGSTMVATQAATNSPVDLYIDQLLRPQPAAEPRDNSATRAELMRLFTNSLRRGGEFASTDRTYLAQLVSRQTGLSPQEAEQRVNQVITDAKTATDAARHAVVKLSLWLTFSLLLGALCSSLAAVEGGRWRQTALN